MKLKNKLSPLQFLKTHKILILEAWNIKKNKLLERDGVYQEKVRSFKYLKGLLEVRLEKVLSLLGVVD